LLCSADEEALIKHALRALSGCTESDKDLTTLNASVAIVGKGVPFKIIDGDDIAPYVSCWCRVAGVSLPRAHGGVHFAQLAGISGDDDGDDEETGAGAGADGGDDEDME